MIRNEKIARSIDGYSVDLSDGGAARSSKGYHGGRAASSRNPDHVRGFIVGDIHVPRPVQRYLIGTAEGQAGGADYSSRVGAQNGHRSIVERVYGNGKNRDVRARVVVNDHSALA